jgi:hypothetical protein
MTTPKDDLKLVFAPGCFDSFDGTQEELDELMAEIQAAFDSGELLEQGTLVDYDDLSDEDLETVAKLVDGDPRQLQ